MHKNIFKKYNVDRHANYPEKKRGLSILRGGPKLTFVFQRGGLFAQKRVSEEPCVRIFGSQMALGGGPCKGDGLNLAITKGSNP